MKRPISVNIIGWLHILGGSLSFLSLFYSLFRESFAVDFDVLLVAYLINFLVAVLTFLAGIKLLEGRSSGRVLFIVSSLLFIGLYWISYGVDSTKFTASIARLLILGFFLYRPRVNEYFNALKVNEVRE